MIGTPHIVGAGLTGLLAAHAWPKATVLESAPGPSAGHRALLRFRTDAVSHLTGIGFRKVRVRKAIHDGREFVPPSIRLANGYSMKVTGKLLPDRSIWNLEPADRYIAPLDFYDQLVDAVGSRIRWNSEVDFLGASALGTRLVSTAPLPIVLKSLGIAAPFSCERASIYVERYKLRNADLFQTIYFPGADTPIYRASITSDVLIVESIGVEPERDELDCVFDAFGIDFAEPIDKTEQRYGKIAPIEDDAARRAVLFGLTRDHGIYSLGRFATWRNILLDDVVADIAAIKRMMSTDAYAQRLSGAS